MSTRRLLKAAQAIREVVSTTILVELRDPRVQNVTVTRVEISPDMQFARVFVSVMGDEAMERRCLQGLESAAGFLQQKVSNRVDMRYTPRLRFKIDKGVKNSIEVARILDDVLPEDEAADDEPLSEDTENE